MEANALVWGGLALALVMFFTWALEVHRTMREILTELKRIRDEVEMQGRRDL
ncbi:MAG: hypothetical protein AAGB93_04160 [Planctomycetota bacterium]